SLVTLDDYKSSPADPGRYHAATPALFATAPLPQTVEFPDLLGDLALGHVRRKGLFLWYFVPRSQPLSRIVIGEIYKGCYAYLIKYDRAGGGQLPDRLADFGPMVDE